MNEKLIRVTDAKEVIKREAEKLTHCFSRVEGVDAVILPCKIGDVVWTFRRFIKDPVPVQGVVSEMFFTPDMRLMIVVKGIARGEWGLEVFAIREEAEQAIEFCLALRL